MTTAVVTGASGGIGSAVSSGLVDLGYRVIGLDLAEPPSGHTWEHLETDLAHTSSLRETIRRIPDDTGIIVHAAANQPLLTAQFNDDAAWQIAWAVNVMSLQVLVAELFSALCLNEPRRVIAIGSVHSRHSSRGIAPYAVCKAAVRAYVRSLALDASPHGPIAVNIELGATDSPKLFQGLARQADAGDALTNLVGCLPTGRLIQPDDVTSLIRWLLEPAADHLTGGSVSLSGGIQEVLASEWGSSRHV